MGQLDLATLKIDCDPGDPVYAVGHLVALLQRAGKRALWLKQERSGSGKGWHLWLRVSPPCRSMMEVIALQAVCGSDRYREANNILRARVVADLPPAQRAYWEPRLNVFYNPVF